MKIFIGYSFIFSMLFYILSGYLMEKGIYEHCQKDHYHRTMNGKTIECKIKE